jgi:hypothetical protein
VFCSSGATIRTDTSRRHYFNTKTEEPNANAKTRTARGRKKITTKKEHADPPPKWRVQKYQTLVIRAYIVLSGGWWRVDAKLFYTTHSSGLGVRAHPTSFPVSSTSAPSRPSSLYYIFNNNNFINTLHHPPPKQNANQKHQWRVKMSPSTPSTDRSIDDENVGRRRGDGRERIGYVFYLDVLYREWTS